MLLVQRMAARRVKHTESESGKDGSSASEPVIAGINRSGKKRLNQLADFESSEVPTAESQENNLLGNQPVRTAGPLENSLTNLLPAQAGMSASNGGESEDSQVAGGSNTSQQTGQVHSDQERSSVTSDSDKSEKEISDFIDLAKDTSIMDEADKDTEKDVVLVEESPTAYDGKHLPKTIKTNRFTSVVTHTHTLRTQIVKCMKNIDKTVAQIVLLENAGGGDSDGDEFIDDLYKDIQSENKEINEKLKKNEELTSQIRTMASFIERSNADSTQPMCITGRKR